MDKKYVLDIASKALVQCNEDFKKLDASARLIDLVINETEYIKMYDHFSEAINQFFFLKILVWSIPHGEKGAVLEKLITYETRFSNLCQIMVDKGNEKLMSAKYFSQDKKNNSFLNARIKYLYFLTHVCFGYQGWYNKYPSTFLGEQMHSTGKPSPILSVYTRCIDILTLTFFIQDQKNAMYRMNLYEWFNLHVYDAEPDQELDSLCCEIADVVLKHKNSNDSRKKIIKIARTLNNQVVDELFRVKKHRNMFYGVMSISSVPVAFITAKVKRNYALINSVCGSLKKRDRVPKHIGRYMISKFLRKFARKSDPLVFLLVKPGPNGGENLKLEEYYQKSFGFRRYTDTFPPEWGIHREEQDVYMVWDKTDSAIELVEKHFQHGFQKMDHYGECFTKIMQNIVPYDLLEKLMNVYWETTAAPQLKYFNFADACRVGEGLDYKNLKTSFDDSFGDCQYAHIILDPNYEYAIHKLLSLSQMQKCLKNEDINTSFSSKELFGVVKRTINPQSMFKEIQGESFGDIFEYRNPTVSSFQHWSTFNNLISFWDSTKPKEKTIMQKLRSYTEIYASTKELVHRRLIYCCMNEIESLWDSVVQLQSLYLTS